MQAWRRIQRQVIFDSKFKEPPQYLYYNSIRYHKKIKHIIVYQDVVERNVSSILPTFSGY
jgi:hypothetical protein